MKLAYEKGLHELGDGLFAYMQPDGTWGWSNAGLVAGDGTSLLVDTLVDLRLTREMLDAMRPITERNPIDAAMNTHGNGDHCWGNQLLPSGIEIYASTAAQREIEEVSPALVRAMQHQLGDGWPFAAFDFSAIEVRPPTATFDGRMELRVGGRDLAFIEVGPAHTAGDTIVHVPDAGVVFTGDILFIEGTPIMWQGPVSNWLRACDRIIELGARALVPGHGPVTDDSGVRDVQRYLTHVRDEARARFDAGMDAEQASDDIDISVFRDWGDPERIAVNVETLYAELDASRPVATPPELFIQMKRWRDRH